MAKKDDTISKIDGAIKSAQNTQFGDMFNPDKKSPKYSEVQRLTKSNSFSADFNKPLNNETDLHNTQVVTSGGGKLKNTAGQNGRPIRDDDFQGDTNYTVTQTSSMPDSVSRTHNYNKQVVAHQTGALTKTMVAMQGRQELMLNKSMALQSKIGNATINELKRANDFRFKVQAEFYKTTTEFQKSVLTTLQETNKLLRIGFSINEQNKKDSAAEAESFARVLFGGDWKKGLKGGLLKGLRKVDDAGLLEAGSMIKELATGQLQSFFDGGLKGALGKGLKMGVQKGATNYFGRRTGNRVKSMMDDPGELFEALADSLKGRAGLLGEIISGGWGSSENRKGMSSFDAKKWYADESSKFKERSLFDKKAHTALTYVIPELLGKLLSTQSKAPQLHFDYYDGKFKTTEGSRKEFDSEFKNIGKEYHNEMQKALRNFMFNVRGKTDVTVIKKYTDLMNQEGFVEEFVQTISVLLVRMGGSKNLVNYFKYHKIEVPVMRKILEDTDKKNPIYSNATLVVVRDFFNDLVNVPDEELGNEIDAILEMAEDIREKANNKVKQNILRAEGSNAFKSRLDDGEYQTLLLYDNGMNSNGRRTYDRASRGIQKTNELIKTFQARRINDSSYNPTSNIADANSSVPLNPQALAVTSEVSNTLATARILMERYPELFRSKDMLDRLDNLADKIDENTGGTLGESLKARIDTLRSKIEEIKSKHPDEDFEISQDEIDAYYENNGNAGLMGTGAIYKNTGDVKKDIKKYATQFMTTQRGKKAANVGAAGSVGLLATAFAKKMGMSPIMAPIAGAATAIAVGMNNKAGNAMQVLFSDVGDDEMDDGRTRREHLIGNMIQTVIPAGLGAAAGIKTSEFIKRNVNFGGILGPIMGFAVGGGIFALTKMGFMKKLLGTVFKPILGIGKFLDKKLLGGAATSMVKGITGMWKDSKLATQYGLNGKKENAKTKDILDLEGAPEVGQITREKEAEQNNTTATASGGSKVRGRAKGILGNRGICVPMVIKKLVLLAQGIKKDKDPTNVEDVAFSIKDYVDKAGKGVHFDAIIDVLRDTPGIQSGGTGIVSKNTINQMWTTVKNTNGMAIAARSSLSEKDLTNPKPNRKGKKQNKIGHVILFYNLRGQLHMFDPASKGSEDEILKDTDVPYSIYHGTITKIHVMQITPQKGGKLSGAVGSAKEGFKGLIKDAGGSVEKFTAGMKKKAKDIGGLPEKMFSGLKKGVQALNVKVVGGLLDGVAAIGDTTADGYKAVMKRASRTHSGEAGKLYKEAKKTFESETELKAIDKEQDTQVEREKKNTSALEKLAGGKDGKKKDDKGKKWYEKLFSKIPFIGPLLGGLLFGKGKAFLGAFKFVGGAFKMLATLATPIVWMAKGLGRLFGVDKAFKAGKDIVMGGIKGWKGTKQSTSLINKAYKSGKGVSATVRASKEVAEEGVEAAVKGTAKAGKSAGKLSKLMNKIGNVLGKLGKKMKKLPIIGKLVEKFGGTKLMKAFEKIFKKSAEKAAKESAKGMAKGATKGGIKGLIGGIKGGLSWTGVGNLVNLAFSAWDIYSAIKDIPQYFNIDPSEVTWKHRLAAGFVAGTLSIIEALIPGSAWVLIPVRILFEKHIIVGLYNFITGEGKKEKSEEDEKEQSEVQAKEDQLDKEGHRKINAVKAKHDGKRAGRTIKKLLLKIRSLFKKFGVVLVTVPIIGPIFATKAGRQFVLKITDPIMELIVKAVELNVQGVSNFGRNVAHSVKEEGGGWWNWTKKIGGAVVAGALRKTPLGFAVTIHDIIRTLGRCSEIFNMPEESLQTDHKLVAGLVTALVSLGHNIPVVGMMLAPVMMPEVLDGLIREAHKIAVEKMGLSIGKSENQIEAEVRIEDRNEDKEIQALTNGAFGADGKLTQQQSEDVLALMVERIRVYNDRLSQIPVIGKLIKRLRKKVDMGQTASTILDVFQSVAKECAGFTIEAINEAKANKRAQRDIFREDNKKKFQKYRRKDHEGRAVMEIKMAFDRSDEFFGDVDLTYGMKISIGIAVYILYMLEHDKGGLGWVSFVALPIKYNGGLEKIVQEIYKRLYFELDKKNNEDLDKELAEFEKASKEAKAAEDKELNDTRNALLKTNSKPQDQNVEKLTEEEAKERAEATERQHSKMGAETKNFWGGQMFYDKKGNPITLQDIVANPQLAQEVAQQAQANAGTTDATAGTGGSAKGTSFGGSGSGSYVHSNVRFVSQDSFMHGLNIGSEDVASAGCALAVAKMLVGFLKLRINDTVLYRELSRYRLRDNSTGMGYFTTFLGGSLTYSANDVFDALSEDGKAAVLLVNRGGGNHYVLAINQGGKVLYGDPEEGGWQRVSPNDPLVLDFIQACTYNHINTGLTDIGTSNYEMGGRGLIGDMWNGAKNIASKAWNGIKGAGSAIGNTFSNIAKGATQTIGFGSQSKGGSQSGGAKNPSGSNNTAKKTSFANNVGSIYDYVPGTAGSAGGNDGSSQISLSAPQGSGVNGNNFEEVALSMIGNGEFDTPDFTNPKVLGRSSKDTGGTFSVGLFGMNSGGSLKEFAKSPAAQALGLGNFTPTDAYKKKFQEVANSNPTGMLNAQRDYAWDVYFPRRVPGLNTKGKRGNQLLGAFADAFGTNGNNWGVSAFLADSIVQRGSMGFHSKKWGGPYTYEILNSSTDPRTVIDKMHEKNSSRVSLDFSRTPEQQKGVLNNRYPKRRNAALKFINKVGGKGTNGKHANKNVGGGTLYTDKSYEERKKEWAAKNGGAISRTIDTKTNTATIKYLNGDVKTGTIANTKITKTPTGDSHAQQWLNIAAGELGSTNGAKYGGPSGAWCMSFVSWCLRQAGVDVPHSASSQFPVTSDAYVKIDTAVPGCVIVLRKDGKNSSGEKHGSKGHAMFYVKPGTTQGKEWNVITGNPKVVQKDRAMNAGGTFVGYYWPKSVPLTGAEAEKANTQGTEGGDAGSGTGTPATVKMKGGSIGGFYAKDGTKIDFTEAFVKYAEKMNPQNVTSTTGVAQVSATNNKVASGRPGPLGLTASQNAKQNVPKEDGKFDTTLDGKVSKMIQWAKSHKLPKSDSKCAQYVKDAIKAGFGVRPGTHAQGFLGAKGHCTGQFAKTEADAVATMEQLGWHQISVDSIVQVGDILAYQQPGKTDWYGHVCILGDNGKWYSDFEQNDWYIYGNKVGPKEQNVSKIGAATLWRYGGKGGDSDSNSSTSTSNSTNQLISQAIGTNYHSSGFNPTYSSANRSNTFSGTYRNTSISTTNNGGIGFNGSKSKADPMNKLISLMEANLEAMNTNNSIQSEQLKAQQATAGYSEEMAKKNVGVNRINITNQVDGKHETQFDTLKATLNRWIDEKGNIENKQINKKV